LEDKYREAHPTHTGPVAVHVLWDWVDGYLEMEEASHDPQPLG
jgi:hypothetical protein